MPTDPLARGNAAKPGLVALEQKLADLLLENMRPARGVAESQPGGPRSTSSYSG